jgi:hypothetical protein
MHKPRDSESVVIYAKKQICAFVLTYFAHSCRECHMSVVLNISCYR